MILPVDDGALSSVCEKFSSRCFNAFPNAVIQDITLESSIMSSDTGKTKRLELFPVFRWKKEDYGW